MRTFPDFQSYCVPTEGTSQTITQRPRRNRQTAAIRGLIQETRLHASQLITPLFIVEGENQLQPILSMPGVFRYSLDLLKKEVADLWNCGIRSVNLFCYVPVEKKDAWASEAFKENNLICRAIKELKQSFPDIYLMADIALDPFTNHGHDGVINTQGLIDNDATLVILGKMALLVAQAGVDCIAPSDMMDGRVGYLRRILDEEGMSHVGILSYAAKYASAFYGPFRDALGSAPKFGDKKTYQMNPANVREAVLEAKLDEREGADLLLIKPALAYLDVIAKVREATTLPIGAYHVSGEYAMVMAAAEKGWLDADRAFLESLLSIRRAGADFILSYAAKRVAPLL